MILLVCAPSTVPLLPIITAATSGQLVQTNPVMLTSLSTNQVTSTAVYSKLILKLS